MGFSAFLVTIPNAEVRSDSIRSCGVAQKHVMFQMKVVNGDRSWICEKRFTDFAILDQVLRSKFWSMAVPRLPSRKMFFNFDEDFINKRRIELEKYTRDLLQVACFSQSDELWEFFTDQASIVGVPPELREENEHHSNVMREKAGMYPVCT